MNRATSEVPSTTYSKGRKLLNWLIFGSGSNGKTAATPEKKQKTGSGIRSFGYDGNPRVNLEFLGGPYQFYPIEVPSQDARCHE